MDFKHFWPLIICVCVCVCVGFFSHLQLFVTPWAICSLPGSSVHGILQARILEWVALPSFRGSSQPRDQTRVSCFAGRFLTTWATRVALQAPPYLGLSLQVLLFLWYIFRNGIVVKIFLHFLLLFLLFYFSLPSDLPDWRAFLLCQSSGPSLVLKHNSWNFLGFPGFTLIRKPVFMFLPGAWKWFPVCWLLFLMSFL